MRRRFLFVTWEGGGNVPPELAIASRLAARGHEVRVLADPTVADDARARGLSFEPFRMAPHRSTRTPESEIIADWGAWSALGAFARARDRHAFAPAGLFAREVVAAQAEHRSDVLVVDAMLFGGLVGAEATGKPWAAVIPMTSFLPAHGRPPPALGLSPARGALGRLRDVLLLWIGDVLLWRSCTPLLNQARRECGLPDLRHPLDQICRARRVLVATSPAFDWRAEPRAGNVVYTGAELSDPPWAAEHPVDPPGEGPLVLVALSSTYQRQEGLLARLLAALAPLAVRALVTTGPSLDPARLPRIANAVVVRSASHDDVLRRARLVVTHGGHGTVLRALAAGVPLLVLPMGRDQADNAARVVGLGAGRWLSARSSVAALRREIERDVFDPAILGAARAMAGILAREGLADAAVECLEGLG